MTKKGAEVILTAHVIHPPPSPPWSYNFQPYSPLVHNYV